MRLRGTSAVHSCAKAIAAAALITAGGASAAQADIAKFDLSASGGVAANPELAIDAQNASHYVWQRRIGGSPELAQARDRAADGTLSTVQDLSDAGQSVQKPQVAVDSQGTTHYVWSRSNGTNTIVQARDRAADGTLSAVQDLSDAGQDASDPRVAVDSQGNTHYVWYRSNGSDSIVQARVRAADGILGAVEDLSNPGQDAYGPQVAADSQGRVHYAWHRSDGTSSIVQIRVRSSNGTLGGVEDLSAAGRDAYDPQVAFDAQGLAYYTWKRSDGMSFVVQARTRAPDGTLGTVQDLSDTGQDAYDPQVAVDSQGISHYVWYRYNGAAYAVQSRTRAVNGALDPIDDLSDASVDSYGPRLDVDSRGNTHVVWIRADGGSYAIQARVVGADGSLGSRLDLSLPGLAAYGPRVAVAPRGTAHYVWYRYDTPSTTVVQTAVADTRATGDSAAVSQSGPAAAIDVLANDDNGDGVPLAIESVTQPAGGSVAVASDQKSLSYTLASGYCATHPGATTDSFTYTINGESSATVAVAITCPAATVAPSPSPSPAPPAPRPAAKDTTAPTLAGARFSSTRFALESGARASARAPRGAKLSLRLSEAATVTFSTEQRVGRRWRKVRSFKLRLRAGKSTIAYSGRLKPRGKQRALKPGRYRLRMRPVDSAGNRGKLITLNFTLVKR